MEVLEGMGTMAWDLGSQGGTERDVGGMVIECPTLRLPIGSRRVDGPVGAQFQAEAGMRNVEVGKREAGSGKREAEWGMRKAES
jgi:hypothetical protein